MKQIICFSRDPWSLLPGRTQQLMTHIKNCRILYFDLAESANGEKTAKTGRQVRPDIKVYSLPRLFPAVRSSRFLSAREDLWKIRFIRRVCAAERVQDPLVWLTSPEQLPYIEGLSRRCLVYDCDTAWGSRFEKAESELARSADVVFAASQPLVEHLAPCSDNVVFLPNGTASEIFRRASEAPPAFLHGLSSPVICIPGPVTKDTDYSALYPFVKSHPGCTFVLTGAGPGRSESLAKLRKHARVVRHSPASVVELHEIFHASDLCVILPDRRHAESGVLPVWYYDMLSSGRPMSVFLAPSQPVPECRAAANTFTAENFSDLCETVLSRDSASDSQSRAESGMDSDWNVRMETIRRVLSMLGF